MCRFCLIEINTRNCVIMLRGEGVCVRDIIYSHRNSGVSSKDQLVMGWFDSVIQILLRSLCYIFNISSSLWSGCVQ